MSNPASEPSQADIFAALAAQASGTFPRPGQNTRKSPFAEFVESAAGGGGPSPQEALTSSSNLKGTGTNNRRIYCTRAGCGSVILSEGVADWTVFEGAVLPDDPASPFPSSKPAESSGSSTSGAPHWHVPQSPFSFDNIGFSKPDLNNPDPLPSFVPRPGQKQYQVPVQEGPMTAPGAGSGGAKVKWLICAECDLGPIGWSWEGGNEAWLVADRVTYGELRQ
ncbi:hypothetical protein I317_05134 [Kwoniella heveanensis CBS 569]|nr:hypothetical protein I317_05134 [Kwoniella heveanensis CBS 569]